jgi:1-acyl-sn-glycerol-3-phosphate acyltransferase
MTAPRSTGTDHDAHYVRPPGGPLAAAYERLLQPVLVLLAPLALCFLVFHLVWGLLTALLIFPVLPAAARDALVQFWSRIALVALGIRLELRVEPGATPIAASRGSLIVSNHTSWADVFVIAAVTPARFVAKSEIAGWPLIGVFARAVGTIFVARRRRHAVVEVNRAAAERMQRGQSVVIFPEGTTTDGTQLLRFHANLFQAGIDAAAPVIPLSLEYRQDGRPSSAAAFIGDMTLVASMWRIVIAPRLTVRLRWLPAIAIAGETRQAVAQRARTAILAALALPQAEAEPVQETEEEIRPATASGS